MGDGGVAALSERRQVIIVGAGPAGAATAWYLASAGVDVLLLDKSPFPRDKVCGDAVSPRALHVLAEMGLLDSLAARYHATGRIRLHAPNHRISSTVVPKIDGAPERVLVVPRTELDHRIQEKAVAAGAEFRAVRADRVLRTEGRVTGVEAEGRSIGAELVVIATGASTGLLRSAGLLPGRPGIMRAARAYYEDVAELEPDLQFHFDGVPLPGYGWVFPCGPNRANVGVGYSGSGGKAPLAAFRRFVLEHPRVRALLSGARPSGPVRAHPLRVDFLRAAKTGPGVLAVGEAAGLVNPFTGEGIDYALESGRIAGEFVARALRDHGRPTPAQLREYARRLDERYRRLFVVLEIARRVYGNRPMLNRILGRGGRSQRLVPVIVEACFGSVDPARAFSPRTLLELIRP